MALTILKPEPRVSRFLHLLSSLSLLGRSLDRRFLVISVLPICLRCLALGSLRVHFGVVVCVLTICLRASFDAWMGVVIIGMLTVGLCALGIRSNDFRIIVGVLTICLDRNCGSAFFGLRVVIGMLSISLNRYRRSAFISLRVVVSVLAISLDCILWSGNSGCHCAQESNAHGKTREEHVESSSYQGPWMCLQVEENMREVVVCVMIFEMMLGTELLYLEKGME